MPALTNVLNLEKGKKKEMAGISLRMMVIALTRGVERKKLFPLFFFLRLLYSSGKFRKKKKKKNSLGIPMMKLGSILCEYPTVKEKAS